MKNFNHSGRKGFGGTPESACGTRALPKGSGFMLIELLVVVGIIGILAGLLLPALNQARSRADRITCVSNMKQFGVALQLYAGEHADHLPPNMDGRGFVLGQIWVEGWLGLPGPDCTNTLYLRRSLLGSYLSHLKVWRCPAAEDVTVGAVTMPRGSADF
jgi:competence protein ComGC